MIMGSQTPKLQKTYMIKINKRAKTKLKEQ